MANNRISKELSDYLRTSKGAQTYEEFIKGLICLHVDKEMVHYCTEHAEQALQEVKEWEHTEIWT